MNDELVDAAHFFWYDNTDKDFLTDLHRVYFESTNRNLKKILGRDRFNYFNKFSSINWIDGDFFKLTNNDNKSFFEIAVSRAQEIINKNKKIIIFWSGGTDSNGVLSIFHYLSKQKTIEVFCTHNSIKNGKDLYEKTKDHFKFNIFENHKNLFFAAAKNNNSVIVDGCGDMVADYSSMNIDSSPWKNAANKNWKFGLNELVKNNIIQIKTNKNDFLNLLEDFFQKFKNIGINVKIFKQLLYILRAGIGNSYDHNIIGLELISRGYKGEVFPFYNTKEFLDYGLKNIEKMLYLDFYNPKDTKKEIKGLVTKVEGKIDSIINQTKANHATDWKYSENNKLIVKTNKNIHIFSSPYDGWYNFNNKNFKIRKDGYDNYIKFSIEIRKKYFSKKSFEAVL